MADACAVGFFRGGPFSFHVPTLPPAIYDVPWKTFPVYHEQTYTNSFLREEEECACGKMEKNEKKGKRKKEDCRSERERWRQEDGLKEKIGRSETRG